MNSDEQTARLEALEAEVRRLRRFVPMLAAGFVLLLAWRFIPGPSTIEARHFIVRDENGQRRAEMAVLEDGRPTFRLNDEEGKARTMWYLNPDRGGNLRFTDLNGNHRLQMMLSAEGEPRIWVCNEDGRAQTHVGLGHAGAPAITISDENLDWVWIAPPGTPISPTR